VNWTKPVKTGEPAVLKIDGLELLHFPINVSRDGIESNLSW
jgi:hypothetical protein